MVINNTKLMRISLELEKLLNTINNKRYNAGLKKMTAKELSMRIAKKYSTNEGLQYEDFIKF